MKPRRPAKVHSARYPRLGPLLYVSSIQFFAVQILVAMQWDPPWGAGCPCPGELREPSLPRSRRRRDRTSRSLSADGLAYSDRHFLVAENLRTPGGTFSQGSRIGQPPTARHRGLMRSDSWWRAGLLAHRAVDPLAQQVGVSVVARVLLDHVGQHPAQRHRPAPRIGNLADQLQAGRGRDELVRELDLVPPRPPCLSNHGRVEPGAREVPVR